MMADPINDVGDKEPARDQKVLQGNPEIAFHYVDQPKNRIQQKTLVKPHTDCGNPQDRELSTALFTACT